MDEMYTLGGWPYVAFFVRWCSLLSMKVCQL